MINTFDWRLWSVRCEMWGRALSRCNRYRLLSGNFHVLLIFFINSLIISSMTYVILKRWPSSIHWKTIDPLVDHNIINSNFSDWIWWLTLWECVNSSIIDCLKSSVNILSWVSFLSEKSNHRSLFDFSHLTLKVTETGFKRVKSVMSKMKRGIRNIINERMKPNMCFSGWHGFVRLGHRLHGDYKDLWNIL
jgi:hypothetical protein